MTVRERDKKVANYGVRETDQLPSEPHPDSARHGGRALLRLHNAVAMAARVCLLFVAFDGFATPSGQASLKIATKKLNAQRYEDYTFEGVMGRAQEECSYMSLVNDTVVRNRTLQAIKEKIGHRKLKEFYEQKEREKQKAKEYYEKVERQSRRRVLEGDRPPWNPNLLPPRPPRPPGPPGPPRPPGPSPPVPFPPPPAFHPRNVYKRSTELQGRRRKGSTSFSEVSFTDHNNCSSRCLFARMEMVDARGFPDESLITKLIEDKIMNKKARMVKTKKVNSCFKKMEEVAFDDSCIFSSRLFDCLDLGEFYSGSR